jgi:hypothetical protein
VTSFIVRICDKKTLYEPWARKRDKDERRSHSAQHPPKPIKFSTHSLPRELRCINEPKGFFITDDAGVLVVLVLRGLISDELHVHFSPNTLDCILISLCSQEAIIQSGIWFSHKFRQCSGSYRHKYRSPNPDDPSVVSEFKNCQAHYGVWNPVGQDVSLFHF